jgi:tetratricopeptide (TPR) repeat protein
MIEIGRYALIVGNSQYDDKALQQLVTPGQDIEALEDVLKNPAIGNFKVEVRRDIENRKLHSDIGQFLTEGRKSTDTLLLYFSGHGVVNAYSGQLYLAVKDSVRDRLGSTAIPTRFIYDCIQESPAGSKIIILDCCYSGAMTTIMLAKSPPKVTLAREFEGKGIVFLSASTAWQYAFQETDVKKLSENTLSLFTRFLVQGLKTGEADRDGDGVITIRELYDYILENVRKETSNQTPEISSIDQQGDIVIANSVKSGDVAEKGQRRDEAHVAEHPQHDPSLLEAAYELALKHYAAQDWPDAVKWLKEVIDRDPKYRDTDFLLKDAEKQQELANLYDQAKKAFDAKDLETACNCFQEILEIDPEYKDAKSMHNNVCKEILYSQASRQLQSENWDEAIKTLTELLDLDSHFEDTTVLLEEARRKKRLAEEYQWALQRYAKAQATGQEEDWRGAVALLQKVADQEHGYKTVNASLARAQRRVKYFDLVRLGKQHYSRGEWQEATTSLEQATKLDQHDPDLAAMLAEAQGQLRKQEEAEHQKAQELYNRGLEYFRLGKWGEAVSFLEEAGHFVPGLGELPAKLDEARKRLRQQRIIQIALGVLNVVLFTLVIAIFQNQIARIGDGIMEWLHGSKATPSPTVGAPTLPIVTPTTFIATPVVPSATPVPLATPTVVIPSIAKTEISMNGSPLDLDKLPTLTGGETVKLEVIAFDTTGKRYSSDDLVCTWQVKPIGNDDQDISTDLCQTYYTPSTKSSSQMVTVEFQGLEQRFESSMSLSLEFDIVK